MMRNWVILVAVAVSGLAGVALGIAIDGSAPEPPPPDDEQERVAVPEPCLAAIDAARRRLLLTGEIEQTLVSYRSLAEDTIDAVEQLSAEDVQRIIDRLRQLNEETSRLIDRAGDARFAEPARVCETLAGVTPSPSPSPTPTSP